MPWTAGEAWRWSRRAFAAGSMHREAYRLTAEHEETHWWFRSRRELFLRQIRRAAHEQGFPGRRLRILDYGCGTGFNLPFLAEFGDVTGADTADEALSEFRKHPQFPRIDLRLDARDGASAAPDLFEIVAALDVLEHLEDDVGGLRTMMQFLAPCGQIVLTVPAYGWLWSGEDVVSKHRRRYTKSTLLQACRSAGLEARYTSYFNLSILPAMAGTVWARRWLERGATAQSSVRPTAPWLNGLLYAVTASEARCVGDQQCRLPAGASLVCRAAVPSG